MIVTDDVKQFYEDHRIPLGKMIVVGQTRRGLTASAIEEAAAQVYNEIQSGKTIPSIRIAWEIFSIAKRKQAITVKSEREEIASLRRELELCKRPWWRRWLEKVGWRR